MEKSGKKWLVGCGVGCGAVVLLGILLSVGGSFFLMRSFNTAVDTQKELVTEYGDRKAYIPPPQGITPDRMEKFLAIRRTVMPTCEKFREVGQSFAAMEEIENSPEDPSTGEVFKAVSHITGDIFGMVQNMGRFTNLRNQALLDNGMGLGEYIWIYVLAYNSWLGNDPNVDIDGEARGKMTAKEMKVMHALVLNHAEALAAVGMTDKSDLWMREADRMKRTETGVPFKDGELPADVIRAFLPYEKDLRDLYCEAMSSFEMNQVRKKGLSIRSE